MPIDKTLVASLDALESAQFLRRLADSEPTYAIKHALIQEAAYQSLLNRTRRDIHRHVANSIENLYADRLDENAGLLAHHYELAGDTEKAIHYLTRSGEQALRTSAFAEASSIFTRAYGLLAADDTRRKAALLVQRGEVYVYSSNYIEAGQLLREALTLATTDGDARTAASALSGLTRIANLQGAHDDALRFGGEAVHWARQANEPAVLALTLRRLGIAYNYLGNNELAANRLNESLALYRELGNLEGIAGCLNSLGIVAREQRALEQALAYIQEALAISRQLGDRYGVSNRLLNLGVIADEQEDFATAARYQQEALALAQEIGDREGVALITMNLGALTLKQGDPTVAMERYRTALVAAISLKAFALVPYLIAAVADLQVKTGHTVQGAEWLGLAFGHPTCTADTKHDFASTLSALRIALPAAELEAAMNRGQTMDLNAVVNEILNEPAGRTRNL